MSRRFAALVVPLATALGGAAATADELPGKYVVTYSIHETPGDDTTPLEWTIQIFLNPIDRDGSVVTWQITKIRFEDVQGERVWADFCGTPPDDWVRTHADPLAPADSEFVIVPLLGGEAGPISGTSVALEYEFQTSGGSVAIAPYAYWNLWDGTTRVESDDVPVVVWSEPGAG